MSEPGGEESVEPSEVLHAVSGDQVLGMYPL